MDEIIDLDALDRKILYQLDLNARIPGSQLAKKVRASKQVVRYRMQRLEERGIITQYVTMIDSSRLGYTTYRCYLKLRGLTPEQRKDILNFMQDQPEIWAVVTLTGKWDLALGISVKTVDAFHTTWRHILERVLPLISDYKICVYEPIHHYAKTYLHDNETETPVRTVGASTKAEHDDTDLRILQLLSADARASLVDIADAVDLSAEAVRKRLMRLEKKRIIIGYRIQIDVSRFGFEYYKAELRLSRFDSLNAVMQFCKQEPYIYQVDDTIGGETLEIEFHVCDVRHMLSIIERMEKRFPGLIERFDYLTVLEQIKEVYMPKPI